MNTMPAPPPVDTACLARLLDQLAQRLAQEVTRLRALRADGRNEAFAGLFARDSDIAALCQELCATPWQDPPPFRPTIEPTSALARLIGLYELTPEEQALLVMAMAPGLDPRFGRVYGFLHEDMTQTHLTPALARTLLGCRASMGLTDSLCETASLRRHGLLRLTGAAWISARLEVPDAVINLAMGQTCLPEAITLMPLHGRATWADRPRLVQSSAQTCPIISGGFAGALWLCDAADLAHADLLATALEAGIAAAMAGASIAYAGWDATDLATRRSLCRSLGRHASVLTPRPDLWLGLGTAFALTSPPPTPQTARLGFWQSLAPQLAPHLAASRLATVTLWRLANEALATEALASDTLPPETTTDPAAPPHLAAQARLAAIISHHQSAPMRGLADAIACPYDFDDLILPAPAKARLRGFAARHSSAARVLEDWGLGPGLAGRPGGIALFTGASGVGKTMAAGVVARATGLQLMRVNLATVVSKYIGETESNLERIFTAAAQSEVILFFDEAEALFSKRAEVKDARDRYANMEMSYLLQRIESFHGMAILASNMGTTLDPALLRRFDLVLEFALPDAAARRALWHRLHRTCAPLAADVDLDHLATRFDIAGGHIRQAILTAAHAAAQSDTPISQSLLIQAIAREYVKLGRTLRREDFGPDFALAKEAG